MPAAEMPGLRADMNDALLELVYDDPLNAWEDVPVLELSGPLDGRPNAVLAALGQTAPSRPPGPNTPAITDHALAPDGTPRRPRTRSGTRCLGAPL